jgi:DNA transposition AAA+ family ATPase
MRKLFAITRNVERFTEAMDRIRNRESNVPGMALLYGEPGLGKTKVALWWVLNNDGVFIRTKKLMTGRWLLEEIVAELGEAPMWRTADLFRQIQEQLLDRPRTVIVDEVDYFDARILETLRDIFDMTNAPMVFIGMGNADKKLMRYKHLFDRFSEIIKFTDFAEADVADIAEQLCEVALTPDAITYIHSKANRFRRIMIELYRAEMTARTNSLKTVSAEDLRRVDR